MQSVYRIAAHFGIFDVDELLRQKCRHTSQLRHWMWFEQMEPFGELRADYRAAQIVSMVHNSPRAAKDQKSLTEFLLKFGETNKQQKQSVEEQILILNVLASTLTGN